MFQSLPRGKRGLARRFRGNACCRFVAIFYLCYWTLMWLLGWDPISARAVRATFQAFHCEPHVHGGSCNPLTLKDLGAAGKSD
eukprot:SAG11_NODE_12158_length_719_cov_1.083871_1_plen_82_part_10